MQWLTQSSCLSDFGEYYIIIHVFSCCSTIGEGPSKIRLLLPMYLHMWGHADEVLGDAFDTENLCAAGFMGLGSKRTQ